MAVQKSKKSRSRRDQRRSHHALSAPTMTEDKQSGERRRRHHIGEDGTYRGKQILAPAAMHADMDNAGEQDA